MYGNKQLTHTKNNVSPKWVTSKKNQVDKLISNSKWAIEVDSIDNKK